MHRTDEGKVAATGESRQRRRRALARDRPPTDRADMVQDAAEREAGLKKLPPGMVAMRDLYAVWPKASRSCRPAGWSPS